MSSLFFKQGDISRIARSIKNKYPNTPGTTIYFVDKDPLEIAPLQDGCLYFAKDSANDKAYIYLDADSKRYAITGPVDWSEIYNKPLSSIISSIEFSEAPLTDDNEKHLNDSHNRYKRLNVYNLDNLTLENRIHLPFLYANQKDTLTAPLILGGEKDGKGDLDTSGKIILDPERGSQITDNNTATLFGFNGKQSSTKNLTVGHSSYNLQLRSKNSDERYSYGSTKVPGPKVSVSNDTDTKVVAYVDDIIPKAYGDENGNQIISSYINFTETGMKENDPYTIVLKNTAKTTKNLITTDYYIGGASAWTAGATVTLYTYKNGVKTAEADQRHIALTLPAGSTTQTGVITHNTDQSFAGIKSFETGIVAGVTAATTNDVKVKVHGAIGLGPNNNVKIHYNNVTDSLDFSF